MLTRTCRGRGALVHVLPNGVEDGNELLSARCRRSCKQERLTIVGGKRRGDGRVEKAVHASIGCQERPQGCGVTRSAGRGSRPAGIAAGRVASLLERAGTIEVMSAGRRTNSDGGKLRRVG